MTAKILTQARLQELLHYDSETGVFTSRTKRGRFRVGVTVGTIAAGGRVHIHLDHKKYLAHRLVWFYTHGRWPEHEIDHINGIPTDNRIANLRKATTKQNGENRDKQRNNTSGYKGVTWSNKSKKWQAQICHAKQRIHIGLFEKAEDAHKAYLAKANALFTHTDRIKQE